MGDDKAHLIVLSGVFYQESPDADLMVADDDLGTVPVRALLAPILGKRTAVVLHHCPPEPPQEDRWGGGSCLLEPSGKCHCGHHERPDWLYSQSAGGTLQHEDGEWSIRKPAGEVVVLHFDWLVGHHSQVVVTALPNVDDLKIEIEKEMENPTVEGLQDRLTQMRDLLSMVNQEKDNL